MVRRPMSRPHQDELPCLDNWFLSHPSVRHHSQDAPLPEGSWGQDRVSKGAHVPPTESSTGPMEALCLRQEQTGADSTRDAYQQRSGLEDCERERG
uniref:Uncharacterized protein n=1 Tax=Knipowitschia caucasica TaxID=637954 RepID=A0AAV2M5W5_KNICA